jgi:hypothetical protein
VPATGPQPRPGPGTAVTRPPAHVRAVHDDSVRAARQAAEQAGGPPDYLISRAIRWAAGRPGPAPFTGTPAGAGAGRGDVAAEITACRRYLETTPYSAQAAAAIGRARHIIRILEWLTGASDLPPAYTRGTGPGDLVGGRGPVVRTPAETAAAAARARAQRDAGDTAGWGSGPGWHDGVIATLEWAAGDSAGPPMAHPGQGPCSHPPSGGPPGGAEMTRELRAAEEHLEPGGYRHGSHSPGYADAVASTLRWLYGQTTAPPVR